MNMNPMMEDLDGDSEQAARALYDHCRTLQDEIVRQGKDLIAQWDINIERTDFTSSALNLAHYLALRTVELREIQPRLSVLGLSSLGRSEANVLASLQAVIASLSRIAGKSADPYPAASVFTTGADLLADRQTEIFGADPAGPYTRIMVTLPSEAAEDPALLQDLIANGADCVRINCAHDTPEKWRAMIVHTRIAAAALKRDVRVLMDLAGPKIRIRDVRGPEKLRLFRGDRFVITHAFSGKPEHPEIVLSHDNLLDHLTLGASISIDDGKLGAKVVGRDDRRATLEVTHARQKGVKLKSEKGVNLPGAELDIPALTREDIANLDFVAANADVIGFSFVQTVEDIMSLVAEISQRRKDAKLPALLLKIETPLAVKNLPRLVVQAGSVMPVAVMIARGDLAVEIGFERLSEIQEEILWLCEAAHVPVVWATQVLDGMVKEGLATRAETTDAAMGQRAECVMLNKGPYLAKAVAFLDGVLRRMDRHQSKKRAYLAPLKTWVKSSASV